MGANPSTEGETLQPPAPHGRAIRAILFDKDGTLIDFRKTWTPAYLGVARELALAMGSGESLAADLLRAVGYDPATDAFEGDSPLLWDTNAGIAMSWILRADLPSDLDVLARIERHFNDHDLYPPQPVGDLDPLMTALRGRGLVLGVATMDNHAAALSTLRLLGIEHHMAVVVGSDSGHGSKPEPGMVDAFTTATGIPAAEILLVGDTPADLVMARNAGCALAVAVRTGATPEHLLQAHADHVLDTIHELETLL